MGLHAIPVEKVLPSLSDSVKMGIARFLYRYNGEYPVIVDSYGKVYYVLNARTAYPDPSAFGNVADWLNEPMPNGATTTFRWEDIYIVEHIEEYFNDRGRLVALLTKEYIRHD